jgi:hypothetical protein
MPPLAAQIQAERFPAASRYSGGTVIPNGRTAMRPRVSFDSNHIGRRLEACETVGRAHGWHPNDLILFADEVRDAFSYEEAMAIIEREFDIVR